MGEPGNWSPATVDFNVDPNIDAPNAGRVCDYWLGGAHNVAVDRELGDKVAGVVPAREFARRNRAFLRRVVRFLVLEAGIRQFLDLGSGVPTVGSVHEIAQQASRDCRVVYVEQDPLGVALWERTLARNELATVVHGDIQFPATVLSHPRTRRLLDFDQPVGVLMCVVLNFIADEADPAGIISAYRQALCAGSHVAISHVTDDDYPIELAHVGDLYKETASPITLRTRNQVAHLFGGFTLVEPGVVFTPQWRPEPGDSVTNPQRSLCYGGVAVR